MIGGTDQHAVPAGPGAFGETQPDGLLPDHVLGSVRRFRLEVLEGPRTGTTWESGADRCSIGSHPLCDLTVEDPTVSRFHCEIRIDHQGARVRDLGSKNATYLDGVRVLDGYLRGGALLRLGRTVVRFQFVPETNRLPLSERTSFGLLVGKSVAMRSTFSVLERAAGSDATILLEGETGTGKSAAARSIHQESSRRGGPMVMVDCGAIPANLLESELFGHERGAFTGATERRIGAFEEASGGTLFLDEIGELPLELQPKLLGVIENREIRRIGGSGSKKVDVRMVAATNRDLRAEVNAGRFRADLYFRLAVVRITLPPLRQRPEDLPALVSELLAGLGASAVQRERFTAHDFIAGLRHGSWPGNVRELRNHLEQCLVFEDALPVTPASPAETPADGALLRVDATLPYAEARQRALGDFERVYLDELLRLHRGKVSQAASSAGIDRTYFYRLLRRHGLKK